MKNLSPKQVAFSSALILSMVSLILLLLFQNFYAQDLPKLFYVLLPSYMLLTAYLVFYYSLEKFIYQRIKLIYKSIYRSKSNLNNMDISSPISSKILEEVEEEVNLWTNANQHEIEQLKKNETFRREFLGNVSHELKTPLFNIQGYIETLLDGGIKDNSINKKYLKKAVKNVERLSAIIEDLELISHIENSQFELKVSSFNLFKLVLEVIESLELKANEVEINIRVKDNLDLATIVYGDREKLSQVLINLVANSIKYGKSGGETTISWYDMDKNVLVEISDNGIGIEKSQINRLFERFYRVDTNRSRERGGTGLGLSIVKHIVEAHHQTINVRSTVGVGSTFGFTLKKG